MRMSVTIQHHNKKLLAGFLLACLLCLASLQAYALSDITILTTRQSPAINRFVSALEDKLNNQPDLVIHHIQTVSAVSTNIPNNTLVVAVGTQALRYASNLSDTTPVIAVLVPKVNFEAILKESNRNPDFFSAIYLDQPFTRQLALIKSISPQTNALGVLLGPSSQSRRADLESAASQLNITPQIKLVDDSAQLQSSLEAVMQRDRMLLAIPDPLIYSRETVRTILLTSYRYHSPVIGFSQSYVKSGAVAAVYTSPEQFASDLGTLISSLPATSFKLPAARPPQEFSIKINHQVAKSLGMSIPDEESIYIEMLRQLH